MWQAGSVRRRSDHGRPTWWLLYAIAVLFVGVVGLVELFVDGQELRKILEVLIVMAGFGLIALWLRGNRIALELERARRRA
jgi:hydrogenase/urease accessory protein HupE